VVGSYQGLWKDWVPGSSSEQTAILHHISQGNVNVADKIAKM